MPITQKRMLAVLDESEAAHEALVDVRKTIEDVLARNEAQAAASAIKLFLQTTLVPSIEATKSEREHFKRAEKRNERNAEYMKNKRVGAER